MRYTPMLTMIGVGFEDTLRREGELQAEQAEEPALAGPCLRELLTVARDPTTPLTRQDEVLAGAIRCYRRTHSAAWSSVVLQLLAPSLAWVCLRIIVVPRGIEIDDVQQQVVIHTLSVADQLRLYQPPIWVRHRLIRRVRTMTRRWLRGTVPDGRVEVPYDDGRGPAQPIWAAIDELLELKAAGVPLAELGQLYQAARRVEAVSRRGDSGEAVLSELARARAARAGHASGSLRQAA